MLFIILKTFYLSYYYSQCPTETRFYNRNQTQILAPVLVSDRNFHIKFTKLWSWQECYKNYQKQNFKFSWKEKRIPQIKYYVSYLLLIKLIFVNKSYCWRLEIIIYRFHLINCSPIRINLASSTEELEILYHTTNKFMCMRTV